MELKHNNSNSEIIQTSQLAMENFLFQKMWKLSSKANPTCYIFQENYVLIIYKTKCSISFTSQIQMEWMKTFHVDKNTIHEKKK